MLCLGWTEPGTAEATPYHPSAYWPRSKLCGSHFMDRRNSQQPYLSAGSELALDKPIRMPSLATYHTSRAKAAKHICTSQMSQERPHQASQPVDDYANDDAQDQAKGFSKWGFTVGVVLSMRCRFMGASTWKPIGQIIPESEQTRNLQESIFMVRAVSCIDVASCVHPALTGRCNQMGPVKGGCSGPT